MRVLGIDPGYATVGWGVLDYASNHFTTIDYGAIITPPDMEFPLRLRAIHERMMELIVTHRPDALSVEKLFFKNNQKTVIDVSQARGVILCSAAIQGIPVYEYTPLQVKSGVVGYGQAVKKQVQEMTKMILKLEKIPKPDDTADALALAICHCHSAASRLSALGGGRR